jgi:hypothetical protein
MNAPIRAESRWPRARAAINRFHAALEQPVRPLARVLLILLCVPLALSVTVPLWRISMEAPQYPNGLWIEVHAHKLAAGNDGQHLAEINTLNHYIGMHAIDPADLAELGWMPFAVGILFLLALRVAVIGSVSALVDLTVMSIYTLGFLGARFAYRLYVYGHDLAPNAPFKVEPFMPAVLGTKQIANFTVHSFPRLGTAYLSAFVLGLMLLMAWELIAGLRKAPRS